MKEKLDIAKVLSHFLGLFLLVFLLVPKFTTMAILAWVLILIVGGLSKQILFRLNKTQLLWIGFYLLYVVGVLFTNHPDIAGKYLEYKLSFIIFPILFSFRPKGGISLTPVIAWFALGTGILSLLGFIHGFQCGERACFLASEFSYIHHPTYFASFQLLSIVLLVYAYRKGLKGFKLAWILPYILFSFVSQMLTLSLAGILLILLVILVASIYVVRQRFSPKVFWASIVIFPLLGYLFLTKTPQVEGEWNNAKFYADAYWAHPENFVKTRVYPFSGTETRLVMWTASAMVIKEHPLGVGTGNVDDALGMQLKKLEQPELAEENLNPHNQYFQVAIEIGILGCLYFFILLFIYLRKAFKNKNLILGFITFSLAFNCLFESMLQRQSGIVFFVFWICLLTTMIAIEKENKLKTQN